jgi:hypothetical protein
MTTRDDTPQWRLILRHEWDTATQERREEICDTLNLSSQTVRRWIRGEGKPKSRQTLMKLEELIPEISQALRQEFSSFFIDSHDMLTRTLAPVYDRVFQAVTDTEQSLIQRTITGIVFDAMVNHVDMERQGTVAILGQLLPIPKLSEEALLGVTHRLRFYAWSGRGTGDWFEDQAMQSYEVDAMSLAGQAVMNGAPIYYHRDRDILGQNAPLMYIEQIKSAVAFPVIRNGKIAGAVFIAAAVPNFFTRLKRDTITLYMRMMSQAFNESDFFAKGQILLPNSAQERIRVMHTMLLDQLSVEHPGLSRKQLLQQLVKEL